MNRFFQWRPMRKLMAGSLLLCAAAGADAVSLDTAHLVALGQPLDLAVKMTLDGADDIKALCLEASVVYGDRLLDNSLIQLAAEESASLQESLVRIRSVVPVDAAVVTVQLRAGCTHKTTRRYVVLAEAQRLPAAGAEGAIAQRAADAVVPDNFGGGQELAAEQEVAQLREELLKLQTALAESQHRLQGTPSQYFPKALMYGAVGGVCVTFGGLLLLFWRRQSRRAVLAAPGAALVLPKSTMKAHSGADAGVRELLLDRLKRGKAPATEPVAPRIERVAELFDLHQQVEFFASLGQPDKAMALLRGYLDKNGNTSALVYLSLLDLYCQTGRRSDCETLGADFNRLFGVEASFANDAATGHNMPAYESVLARIEAAWPERRVFDILDEVLFCEPGDPAKVLDLEAYRELLLLHAVAREIMETESDSGDCIGSQRHAGRAMQPPASPRLGLDIDLSQWGAPGDNNTPASGTRGRAGSGSSRAYYTTRSPGDSTVLEESVLDPDARDTPARRQEPGMKR